MSELSLAKHGGSDDGLPDITGASFCKYSTSTGSSVYVAVGQTLTIDISQYNLGWTSMVGLAYERLQFIAFTPRLSNTNASPAVIVTPGKDATVNVSYTATDSGRVYEFVIVARIVKPTNADGTDWKLQYDVINTGNAGYSIQVYTGSGFMYSIVAYM